MIFEIIYFNMFKSNFSATWGCYRYLMAEVADTAIHRSSIYFEAQDHMRY